MNILGLKITGHDTGAALIADGKIVAIGEERLNRIKHSPNIFPSQAIDYCLDAFKFSSKDIDLVVIGRVGAMSDEKLKQKFFRSEIGKKLSHADIQIINHHDAHAASAFLCSPFEESAIFVSDCRGEHMVTHMGVAATETETLYYGFRNRFFQIQKTAHVRNGDAFPFTTGIGQIYSLLSDHYLNFGPYNEGKMMGLAPYGTDVILKRFPAHFWFTELNGHLVCNPWISYPKTFLDFKNGLKYFFRRKIIETKIKNSILSKLSHRSNLKIFKRISLPRPSRKKDDALPDDYYASVAYAGQKILEQILVAWGKKLINVTRSENLCVAGGVGLNIDANKRFLDDAGFKHIFVQPAASDSGIALGAALYGWHIIADKPRHWIMKSASLGKPYGEGEILRALQKHEQDISFKKVQNIPLAAAQLIAEKNIIGWFHGGAEYGPRALGNRSIICDSREPGMKDRLNNKVKHREPWRPFAASILEEHMEAWFDIKEPSQFMLIAALVREDKRNLIPSVVHVDGTSRIQSVTAEANERYYHLIDEFYKLTKVPLILNTSFNLGGDPIVETPEDALNTFLKTQIDYLILEDYLVTKKL